MLNDHGIWYVSKGNRIKVFKDAWIPGLNGRRIRLEGRDVEGDNISVEQLIDPNERRWNLSSLEEITTEEENVAIQSIHVSQTLEQDSLKWPKSTDGMARPRLVYR